MCSTVGDIRSSFAGLRFEKKLRHREIANFLQISEAELIDVHVGVTKFDVLCSSPHVARAIRLKPDWRALLEHCNHFELLTSVTRNQSVVMEQVGSYEHVALDSGRWVVHDKGLQLRFSPQFLGYAYLFEEAGSSQVQKSIQFFDENGQGVHKAYLLPQSQHLAFELLAKRYAQDRQLPGISIQETNSAFEPAGKVAVHLDSADLIERWRALQSFDQMLELLESFHVTAAEAFEAIGASHAQEVSFETVKYLLESAAYLELPLEISVCNEAVSMTSRRMIHRITESNGWLSVLDPGFSLRIHGMDDLRVWLVQPGSIEILGSSGESLLSVRCVATDENPGFGEWHRLFEACQDDVN